MQAAEPDWEHLPSHPRLFATATRFEALKTQRDPASPAMINLLRLKAEYYLTAPPISYPQSGMLLWEMREVQGRVITLAMMFRLTGDQRYAVRARAELLQLAALPEWGIGHFLDVGEACLASGIGLDWLYDELSGEDREKISKAIVVNGLLPSLEVKDESGSWLSGDFNWNQVCHCGLSVGALAIAEREPALAQKIVDRAIQKVPNAGAAYAPDGSFPEGPSYWSYGTTFHVLLIEALRSALADAHGLDTLPGFLKTADFKLQMAGPSGEEFNFADYHQELHNDPVLFWFARELNRADIASKEERAIASTASDQGGNVKISRFTAFGLLWWNPEIPPLATPLPLHWTAGGHLPLAVLRSAWDDPRATWLVLKGGTPNGSHAHMDVGSFVLEKDGVRWALDLGTENYDRMRAAKIDLWNYTQESSRWTTFRCGPEGHNIPRFDGARQNITGRAEIRALPDENGSVGNVTDLSPLYQGQVASVSRTVHLLPDRSVSIQDDWQTGAQPVEYTFQWLTKAKVTRQPDTLLLEQNGETLQLHVAASGPFAIEVQDVSAAQAPQDSPNPDLKRIVIRQKTAARTAGQLTITSAP